MTQAHAKVDGLIWLALLVAALSVGCAAPPATAPDRAAAEIVNLRLLTSPAPVVIGSGTQPNGVWVQVYAFQRGQTRATELPPGVLELLLFDGSTPDGPDEQTPHLRVAHASQDIAAAASTTVAGVRYMLPVRWDANPPDSGIVTLVVRFAPQQGTAVYSSPVSIRLGPT